MNFLFNLGEQSKWYNTVELVVVVVVVAIGVVALERMGCRGVAIALKGDKQQETFLIKVVLQSSTCVQHAGHGVQCAGSRDKTRIRKDNVFCNAKSHGCAESLGVVASAQKHY